MALGAEGEGEGAVLTPSCPCQELLRHHQLLEPAARPRDSYVRQSRHRERRELHRLKREHEQTAGRQRKVLRLQDGEEAGSSSGDEGGTQRDVDIQVGLLCLAMPAFLILAAGPLRTSAALLSTPGSSAGIFPFRT